MFGGGSGPSAKAESPNLDSSKEPKSPSPENSSTLSASNPPIPIKTTEQAMSGEKRSGNGSPPGRQNPDTGSAADKKRRSSGVGGKASSFINAAKNSFINNRTSSDSNTHSPLQKLGKQDPALVVPQGSHNNSAGESLPGPRSTFRVGVWEDKNKKCRRTMEDTHAFLYNFLATPTPATAVGGTPGCKASSGNSQDTDDTATHDMVETDNGYFAIFDGHAGTFAADWCGKKLHIILEEIIRKNPNQAIPQLLDDSFCAADAQLEKLPLKNSGCTAAIAVLRWEDRVTNTQSVTGSQAVGPAMVAAGAAEGNKPEQYGPAKGESTNFRLKTSTVRQRVLYTANVGDARIILCRNGKALRLTYDHKGSDENEGRRIANAGGLILHNRVNGVLAVTRALGDSYMKELVTGHPYTTETVIQPDVDEYVIIACDGLWDVCNDQEAVNLTRDMQDPVAASKFLVEYALSRFSTDNLSCMIVRFDREALKEAHKKDPIGVEGDASGKLSEVEKLVHNAKQSIAEGSPAIGVSATNSGKGHDLMRSNTEDSNSFTPTIIEGSVQEESTAMDMEDDCSSTAQDTPTASIRPLQQRQPITNGGDEGEKTPVPAS